MASMWRRAMVYLGLQDDDELDYGGEYEPYGDYGDHHLDDARDPRDARDVRDGRDGRDDREPAYREPAAARAGRDVPPDYAAPEPPPRPSGRENPSGVSVTRGPAVVRTIGPSTAARVHIVEPQSFNDVQEVGDRLKANQPVILNLQAIAAELRRRLVDFSSGLAYATGGTMARVADRVYLLTPSNVEISQEEKDRLQARGLFQP